VWGAWVSLLGPPRLARRGEAHRQGGGRPAGRGNAFRCLTHRRVLRLGVGIALELLEAFDGELQLSSVRRPCTPRAVLALLASGRS
jgi:hypothetical protein